jgi:hypothetical protein
MEESPFVLLCLATVEAAAHVPSSIPPKEFSRKFKAATIVLYQS